MKKLVLVLAIVSFLFSRSHGQTLINASGEFYTNDVVTVTAQNETNGSFIDITDQLPSVTDKTTSLPGVNYTTYVRVEQVQAVRPYNPQDNKPTQFKFKVINDHPSAAITVKFTFQVSVIVNFVQGFRSLTYEITIKAGNRPPSIFYNDAVAANFVKTNCTTPGTIGSTVKYTVPANKYSGKDKNEANQKAADDLVANGPNYANANGTCIPGWYNEEKSQTFTPVCSGVDRVYQGPNVTYTVYARNYTAPTLLEANQKALNDIAANGQAYANSNNTGTCTQMYYNIEQAYTIFKDNCGTGYIDGSINYVIPARKYSSTTPPTRGNDFTTIMTNDARTEGQAYANNNLTCEPLPSKIYLSLTSDRGGYVIQFFKDAAKSQAIYVNSFVVKYTETPQGQSPVNKQVTCTGSTYVISGRSIVLAPGTGYQY